MGTAGDDGQEIFRWRVMLRKGKLRLPYTPTSKHTEGPREEAGAKGGGARPCGVVTPDKHYSGSGQWRSREEGLMGEMSCCCGCLWTQCLMGKTGAGDWERFDTMNVGISLLGL